MKPEDIHNSRILISPLNWGLGHVSRCIGLISQLIDGKNVVVVACSDEQRMILQQYFPKIEFVEHVGYPFVFGGKGRFAWDILKQFKRLSQRISTELAEVEILIDKYQIDIVISDHRFGFRSDRVTSICVTHQLNLPLLWYEFPIQILHKRYLRKFNQIWVMDFADSRLAGKLSRNSDLHAVKYIGPYSRFQLYEIPKKKKFNLVFVASGPAIYAQQLIDTKLGKSASSNIVVLTNESMEIPIDIQVKSGDWLEQDQIILGSNKIISRSGYSTFMDLYYLGISAELIPTQGQREQVYLKELHDN